MEDDLACARRVLAETDDESYMASPDDRWRFLVEDARRLAKAVIEAEREIHK